MNARLKLRLIKSSRPKAKAGRWPSSLGTPVDPMANTYAARAHSLLLHMDVRDPRGLSPEQAKDVIRWFGQPV